MRVKSILVNLGLQLDCGSTAKGLGLHSLRFQMDLVVGVVRLLQLAQDEILSYGRVLGVLGQK